MTVTFPKLEEGRIYHREDVADYIATQNGLSDFNVMKAHFPRSLDDFQFNSAGLRDEEEVLLQYHVFLIEDVQPQVWSRIETFRQHKAEWDRVEAIIQLLNDGAPFFPVIIQQNDPQRRTVEGHHRAAAMRWLGGDCLPAFLAGYRNWFIQDELVPEFDREDEIVPVPRNEVFAFFRRATCIDQKGITLNILDGDWLRQCDEALVARYQGRVIGAVTMTVRKGRPAIPTVYSLKQYRRKGVAYRLFLAALLRFQEAGANDIHCDVQSEWIAAVLDRLGRERPDLRALVREHMDYHPGIGIEVDVDCVGEELA